MLFLTIVAAAAASLSAVAASVYTWLTFRLVRSQAEPNVIVYVRHDESRPSILQIVVENIGRGLASDLRFEASRPIPTHAWGTTEREIRPAKMMAEGPLIAGIPTLAPGDSRKISWGQYAGLEKALDGNAILLTCRYKHGAREVRPVVGTLEIKSFAGTDAVESEGRRIIKQLERIAESEEALLKLFDTVVRRVWPQVRA